MWATTDAFLDHFGLESLDELPGVDELKAAGLLDTGPVVADVRALSNQALPGIDDGNEGGEGDEDDRDGEGGEGEDGEDDAVGLGPDAPR
jgi:segregation and condensation protein B